MAKKWYPVVDYLICEECGTCVAKCPHGVYDIKKAPSPVVTNPDECVDHCHGCGNRCPVGAITYVGDDTGWTPPNKTQITEESACSCGCKSTDGTKIVVEYLYLDLQTCERCIGTDNVLDEVMLTLTPALEIAGYKVEYNKAEIKTAKLAEQYRFLSSPTIRVNGRDICTTVQENNCGCCGEISGTQVDCRVFEYNGEIYEVPPKQMLAEAILRFALNSTDSGCSCGGYKMPQNLKDFFDGKKNKSGCSCGGGNCE